MRDGFAFVGRSLPMRALLLLVGLISLVGMPYVVLMPIFADQILGTGSGALGLLLGANGVGALMSALVLAMRSNPCGLERWVARAALSFGVLLALFAISESLWISLLLLPGIGASAVMQMASTNTLLQTLTTDEMRGRVMSAYSIMFFGMAPLGSLFAGSVADIIGAPNTVLAGALISLAGAICFRLSRSRRTRDQLRDGLAVRARGGEPVGFAALNADTPVANGLRGRPEVRVRVRRARPARVRGVACRSARAASA